MEKRLDTIAAISTPQGIGGIGIIRISGFSSLDIARKIIETKADLSSIISQKKRRLIHAYLLDSNKEKIDEILLAIMPPGKSFTGELTVEINCHGGKALLQEGLEIVLKAGATLAEPGEFTRRAFANGKLDLIQAEAINELINARVTKTIKIANRNMEGGLSKRVNELRKKAIALITELLAWVDIDNDEQIDENGLIKNINNINFIINDMLGSVKTLKLINQGYWVVLAGPPNSGKSSIFNSILNLERSIVCDLPGTTRDHISESIILDGIEVRLTDTAGIRLTDNLIENISMERSRQQMDSADLVVYVLDKNAEINADIEKEAENILSKEGIILINKNDLSAHSTINEFVISHKDNINIMYVSAITKDGVNNFLNKVAERISELFHSFDHPFVTNIRQKNLLEEANNFFINAKKLLEKNPEMDLVIYEIKQAIKSLETIVGIVTNEEILDNIFKKFCVGK